MADESPVCSVALGLFRDKNLRAVIQVGVGPCLFSGPGHCLTASSKGS